MLKVTKINLHALHNSPMYPGSQPWAHVPFVWRHASLLTQYPHVALHPAPYVPGSHSIKQNEKVLQVDAYYIHVNIVIFVVCFFFNKIIDHLSILHILVSFNYILGILMHATYVNSQSFVAL